jgi:transglutaminase-like putative cysteine protease
MLLVASMAILQADLIDGLHIVPIAATLALLSGWLLGKSAFSERTAHLMAIIYGLFFVTWLVGTTLPFDGPWRERVFDLVGRQVEWLQKLFDGGTSRDGIVFVIQTTAVFWLLGYLAGWFTFRRTYVWRVVIPIGVVLLSVVYYYNGPKPLLVYLAIYTLLALLFVAITYLNGEENRWRNEAVRYDRAIQFDFLRAGLLAALLALLMAWSLPGMKANAGFSEALTDAGGPWRSFQDTWTRLFSSLRSYGAGTSDPYADTMVLGGPRTVGNTLVMDVRVSQELPYGVYWQAIAYDTYVNGGWRVVESDVEPVTHFPDDGPLNLPTIQGREVITQTVTNYLPNSSFLYAAPEVLSTDRQMFVDATYDEQGQTLVTALRSRFILRQGDQYQVASRVSTADATTLRVASTDYPQWVRDRYLQLPDTVTPRTLDLATQLAGAQANPYDKAIAVRDYLRANIDYNDQIAAAPEGVEPLDYVLFDLKQGYCTYYASAMAVMLRSQGVPARVVSGYALGEYDPTAQNYRVRAVNAHTWVEVYFPDYGWIHFEPTQSIPVVERPTSGSGETAEPSVPISNAELFPLDDEVTDLERANGLLGDAAEQANRGLLGDVPWWQVAIGVVLLLVAGMAVWAANRYNRGVEGDVGRSYLRLGEWARVLGIPWRATQTPYEQADALVAVVPQGQQPIRNLTRQYVLRLFSPARATDADFDPYQEWRSLRPVLLRQSVVNVLNRARPEKK